jgi:hypothetical protein
MSELAVRPLVGFVLFVIVGSSFLAALFEALGRHSTLARVLLLFSSLSSLILLAVGWTADMQPFHHPLVGWVLVSSGAAFFTVFWSSSVRGPRLLTAILVLASSVSFALWPAVVWPWRQAQSLWFLWSEILFALSAGALWASAARVDLVGARAAVAKAGADDPVSLNTVAVGLVAQTLALLLLGTGAQVAWGSYWSWDPIESWRLAAWLATTALAIVLGQLGWRRRRARLATNLVAAFALFVLWGSFPLVHWLGLLSPYLPN